MKGRWRTYPLKESRVEWICRVDGLCIFMGWGFPWLEQADQATDRLFDLIELMSSQCCHVEQEICINLLMIFINIYSIALTPCMDMVHF